MDNTQTQKAIDIYLSAVAADPFRRLTEDGRKKISDAIGNLTEILLSYLLETDARAASIGEEILKTAEAVPPESLMPAEKKLASYEIWRGKFCELLGLLQNKLETVPTEPEASLCRDLELIGRKLLNVTGQNDLMNGQND